MSTNKIYVALLISIAFLTSTLISNDVLSQNELKYRLRGEKSGLRYEGVIQEPVSANFTLISATLGRVKWDKNLKPSELNIRFYSLSKTKANVRVREINSLRSYRLDAARDIWSEGWNYFGPWPTSDVIDPLKLEVNNLGITVTESKSPNDSGQLFPAILFQKGIPPLLEKYTFIVKSSTGLSPFSWSLYRVKGDRNLRVASESRYIEKLPAGTPFDIHIRAKELIKGYYKLRIRGELLSHDRKEIVRKTYIFYRQPNS